MAAISKQNLRYVTLGQILAVVALLGLTAVKGHGATWAANQIAGIAIAIPAVCLWALARLQLGESFAIRAEAKALVTHGLYSRIQNPVYVFGGLLVVGILIFIGRPAFFLLLLILIPMQWIRARKERAVLEAKFGDEYRRYRKRTWF
jgi:protein-S-isoprenylcysteine O-methyltransferase Ste14